MTPGQARPAIGAGGGSGSGMASSSQRRDSLARSYDAARVSSSPRPYTTGRRESEVSDGDGMVPPTGLSLVMPVPRSPMADFPSPNNLAASLRRPSATSYLSSSLGRSVGGDSPAMRSASQMSHDSSLHSTHTAAQSPPTTPKTRLGSSRSKILASSARAVENSPPPVLISPHYRREGSFSTDVSLPLSPNDSHSRKSSIVLSTATGQSILERKKRLASVSGPGTFDDANTDSSSLSNPSQKAETRGSDQASEFSSGGSPGPGRNRTSINATSYDSSASDPIRLTEEGAKTKVKSFFGLKKDKSPSNEKSTGRSALGLENAFDQPRPANVRSRSYSRRMNVSDQGSYDIDPPPELPPMPDLRQIVSAESGQPARREQRERSGTILYTRRQVSLPVPDQKPAPTVDTNLSRSDKRISTSSQKLTSDSPRLPPTSPRSTVTSPRMLGSPAKLATDASPIAIRPKTADRMNSSEHIQRFSLRSFPSDTSIRRVALDQSNPEMLSQTPIRDRSHRRSRRDSRGSASIRSVASFASSTSIPTRTTSLRQPSQTGPPSPGLASPSMMSHQGPWSPTGSSYKSIPASPEIRGPPEMHPASPPQAIGTRSGVKHSSWRQSSALSSTAAAGHSGASALAAIKTSFGDTSTGDEEDVTPEATMRIDPAADTNTSLDPVAERVADAAGTEDGSQVSQLHNLLQDLKIQSDRPGLSSLIPDRSSEDSVGVTRKEPLRPTKSPLRIRNLPSGIVSESGHGMRSVSAPSGMTRYPTSALASAAAIAERQRRAPGQSSSDNLGTTDSSTSLGKPPPSPGATATSGSPTSRRSRTSPVASKRTSSYGDPTRQPYAGSNESNLSLVTDSGTEGGHDRAFGTPSQSKRKATLRKATPPVFTLSFGKNTGKDSITTTSDELGSLEDQSLDHRKQSVAQSSRKKSIWKLGLGSRDKDKEDRGIVSEDVSPSSSRNRLGKSTRARKSEPQVSRPQIRRVFDDADGSSSINPLDLIHDTHNGLDDTTQGSLASMVPSESNDSLTFQMPTPSSELPATPAADDVPPHLKRLLRRCNAIRELVETERTYAADLAIVRDVYLARAKSLAGISAASPLSTPLSITTTPILASATGTPISAQGAYASSIRSTPPMPWSGGAARYNNASSEAPLGSPAQIQPASAFSHAASSQAGNRSSTYTIASHASSDLSFQWPPTVSSLPGTPSAGQPSITHKSSNLSVQSPAPSFQQQQQQPPSSSASRSATKIQTSALGTPTLPGDGPLTMSDIRVIFAHLESCCSLAHEMATLLNASMGTLARERVAVRNGRLTSGSDHLEDDRIGQLFITVMPRIEAVFTAYCSRHEASMLRLRDTINASPKAANFFRECTEVARKRTNAWDLGSLLIKPVQRVLKYPLLIQQILGLTEAKHPDQPQLQTALKQIQAVADKINQVKRRRDLADFLITGRDRDAKALTSSPLAPTPSRTIKKKAVQAPRQSNSHAVEEQLLNVEALDQALAEYAEVANRFEALRVRVSSFGKQCGAWSHALRECYFAQLRIVGCLRRAYGLRPAHDEVGEGSAGKGPSTTPGRTALPLPSGPEDGVVKAYADVLNTIVTRSWRQMDAEIRSAILPMTDKVERMFEAPRAVIAKRAERESDFTRARAVLQIDPTAASGRSLDRKVLDNANGFVALQAQLLDELPTFLHGVQVLLDVGVQAFARLQAAHLNEVRNLVLHFWSDQAGHADEVEWIGVEEDESLHVGPTLRNTNPVRVFWESHRAFSQWGESLTIVRRGSDISALPGAIDVDDLSESENEDGLEDAIAQVNAGALSGDALPVTGAPTSSTSKPGSFTSDPSTRRGGIAELVSSNVSARRPSVVAGLMRSISGTFARESPAPSLYGHDADLPPMPTDAENLVRLHRGDASRRAVSDAPPTLPNLSFRRGGGVATDDVLFSETDVVNGITVRVDPAEAQKVRLRSTSTPLTASVSQLAGAQDGQQIFPSASTTSTIGPLPTETSPDDSQMANLSIGTDGNTSTRSNSFVSAESVEVHNVRSRQNSTDPRVPPKIGTPSILSADGTMPITPTSATDTLGRRSRSSHGSQLAPQ